LKETEEEAVKRLSDGESVRWMGFGIRRTADGLRYSLTSGAWASLAEKFDAAHEKPNSPIAANASVAGWVSDKGPCYPTVSVGRAHARMQRLAAARGFEDILDRGEVQGLWQRAYARWCKLRTAADAGAAGASDCGQAPG
jgi:hypothetical protein